MQVGQDRQLKFTGAVRREGLLGWGGWRGWFCRLCFYTLNITFKKIVWGQIVIKLMARMPPTVH